MTHDKRTALWFILYDAAQASQKLLRESLPEERELRRAAEHQRQTAGIVLAELDAAAKRQGVRA